MNLNTSMALDFRAHHLFVAGGKPGKLFILDTVTGKPSQIIDAVEGADDLAFDTSHGRVYLSGAGGLGVYQRQLYGRSRLEVAFPNHGGKTSLFVHSLDQLYSVYRAATPQGCFSTSVYLAMSYRRSLPFRAPVRCAKAESYVEMIPSALLLSGRSMDKLHLEHSSAIKRLIDLASSSGGLHFWAELKEEPHV